VTRADASAILAIDAGSSRLRVSLLAVADGSVIASGARPTRVVGGELDVDALWDDLLGIVADLELHRARVAGIGVAAQLGLVVVDERGRPVRPALLWGDVRAGDEADQLAETLPTHVTALAGRRITGELPLAKLAWLAAHEPGTLVRAAHALSLKDAIVQRLTGVAVTDETHASYSGMFDVAARRWSGELLARAGIDPALLPPTRLGTARAGGLTAAAAGATGLPIGTPVAVGGPDGTLGVVGAGGVRPGVTVDVAGTTDVLLHTTDHPLADPSGAAVLNAHVLPGLWTTGGPTGLTGGAVEWTARLLGFASAKEAHEQLPETESDALVGADGVTFVTALSGTRFPSWQTGRAAAISGLRADHRPAHVLRAAREGAVFTVADGLDAIAALGHEVAEVVVVGGAASRPAALQLRSDAWGTPVASPSNTEATTIGAAILAAVAAGELADAQAAAAALIGPVTRRAPRPDASRALAQARRRWHAASTTPEEVPA
jgi:xylulokinase